MSLLEAYRAAVAQFRAGVADVIVPVRTCWLSRFRGVRCQPAPT